MHGANRTGRPFTGDFAGILLYETLFKLGFANKIGSSEPDDGLELVDCRITNAVKCLPPQNKPATIEICQCNGFLASELAESAPKAVLALGAIAHQAALQALGLRIREFPFGHHAVHDLPGTSVLPHGVRLISSYHCSRYNTQTRRLTPEMFFAVMRECREFIDLA